jgi:uncharacterized repeat protein (TIGR04076 family)
MRTMSLMDDTFPLYDLEISVAGDPDTFVCSHQTGQAFRVVGENLVFPENRPFSLYALAALMPLLPVKQRWTPDNDWVSSDDYVRCPDPHCGAQFKIARVRTTTFHHADVTRVPLARDNKKA